MSCPWCLDANAALLKQVHTGDSDGAYTCWVTNNLGGALVGPFRVVTAGVAQLELSSSGRGLRVRGAPGVRYQVEASMDLQSWFKLWELKLTSEGEETAATGVESLSYPNVSQFFRARRLP